MGHDINDIRSNKTVVVAPARHLAGPSGYQVLHGVGPVRQGKQVAGRGQDEWQSKRNPLHLSLMIGVLEKFWV